MSKFSNTFRTQLLDKIRTEKKEEELVMDDLPLVTKNIDPNAFSPRPTEYYSKHRNATLNNSTHTATLPSASPLNKPVHERMKSFVKDQLTKK